MKQHVYYVSPIIQSISTQLDLLGGDGGNPYLNKSKGEPT